MKKRIMDILQQMSNQTFALADALYTTPELGYKEFKTKEILVQELQKCGYVIEKEYARTGFQVSIGTGHPHIGLIAELDAIPVLGHPYANVNDHSAAHACGHSTQCAIMTSVMQAFKQVGIMNGKVTLFFTPAEEFTDIAYRKELISKGELHYFGGKQEMLYQGVFDDVDVCIHLHAMGNNGYRFSSDSQLTGFLYKKFTFLGKASHAAMFPELGINALNAFTLFQSAAAMLRETFVDEDKNRFHGIVIEGGQTVNSIPEKVVYESYVRSFNTKTMHQLSEKLTHAAKCCASALGAECIVEDIPGYLPFHPSKELVEVVETNMLEFCSDQEILRGERSAAAGDIGDLGTFIPTIQFGYGGFDGVIHGKDFCVADKQRVYVEPAKLVAMIVMDLLDDPLKVKHIVNAFTCSMSKEAYCNYLNKR